MKIKWYGHAAFRITSDAGMRIIFDPYVAGSYGDQLTYGKIEDQADLVLTSHSHPDHNGTGDLLPGFDLVNTAGETTLKGISIKGIPTCHDACRGKERGLNLVFCLEIDGLRVCHLGDLGHILSDREVREVIPVDILLLPVGGFYTINSKEAGVVAEKLAPSIVIPMHYRTARCTFPIMTVDDFLKGKKGVKRPGVSEIAVTRETLPPEREIVVLEHAL
jgi:L-ascorbate metabolism protein UlaG (beta-lactamase superfamily)